MLFYVIASFTEIRVGVFWVCGTGVAFVKPPMQSFIWMLALFFLLIR